MEDVYLFNEMSRQSHYDAVKRQRSIQERIPSYISFITVIREFHPGMGLRTMYKQFQPPDIGRDAFISMGLQAGFRINPPPVKIKTTIAVKHSKYTNLLGDIKVTDVNQVWVSDIFYFEFANNHYYGILIMDIYSRKIIGYNMADNMRAENNLNALQMALKTRRIDNYQRGLIHHSDRGTQYMCNEYTSTLESRGIQISVAYMVLENSHSERLNGTIKNQYLSRWPYQNEDELFDGMKRACTNYNNKYHSELDRTPNEYEVYLKNVPMEKRLEMDIFTIKRQVGMGVQLDLFESK